MSVCCPRIHSRPAKYWRSMRSTRSECLTVFIFPPSLSCYWPVAGPHWLCRLLQIDNWPDREVTWSDLVITSHLPLLQIQTDCSKFVVSLPSFIWGLHLQNVPCLDHTIRAGLGWSGVTMTPLSLSLYFHVSMLNKTENWRDSTGVLQHNVLVLIHLYTLWTLEIQSFDCCHYTSLKTGRHLPPPSVRSSLQILTNPRWRSSYSLCWPASSQTAKYTI